MFMKKTLTTVAVDSIKDYLKEKLERLKELDLDKNGQKDVDQIGELLLHLSDKVKAAIESTDFPKLASGLDQIVAGAGLVGSSFDREKLSDACTELGTGLKQLGHLLQLGIRDMQQLEKDNS